MRKPNVSYFKVFCCKCFVLNTKDNLEKFDAKFYEAIFVGYSNTSKAYRVFNKSTLTIEESIHVKFEESNAFVNNVEEINFLGEDIWDSTRTEGGEVCTSTQKESYLCWCFGDVGSCGIYTRWCSQDAQRLNGGYEGHPSEKSLLLEG